MSKTATVVVIAAAAFGAGAVAGMLFAPASGEENRRRLAQQVKDQTTGLEKQIKDVESNISNLEKQIRQSGQEIGARVKTAANSAIDRLLPDAPNDDSWNIENTDVASDLPHMPKV